MAVYKCSVCDTLYEEAREGKTWDEVAADWLCPVCESGKDLFEKVEDAAADTGAPSSDEEGPPGVDRFRRLSDETESHMADIHTVAESGTSIIEPMRTRLPVISWDDILIKGAQLAQLPLNEEEPVSTRTVIGPGADVPLALETPIFVTHMSFGALSKEAKLALARGSAAAKTAMCSGEGGILPESLESAYRYIFEYVPNRYSVTEENLKAVDAVEIKFGQSVKPGMGGHLPGTKVTAEIAAIRGFSEGKDIISPARFADIGSTEDLKKKIDWLREVSGGKPVGVKFAAGNIEADLEAAIPAKPDFITIDGRAGATGAALKFVKAAASIPSLFALFRARRFLREKGIRNVSLIITGGLRVSSDFAKALALGADAIAVGTAALMAIGCRQFRICDTGKCPMGITTQDPELRARFDIEDSARRLENFLKVSTEELRHFARMTGNDDIHKMSVGDLCTADSEISSHTDIEHV